MPQVHRKLRPEIGFVSQKRILQLTGSMISQLISKKSGEKILGGRGSGRTASFGMMQSKCHEMHSVDIAYLRRQGSLRRGASGQLNWSRGDTQTGSIGYRAEERGLRLIYRTRQTGGDWQDMNELIPFTFTGTNFSGRRQWFECPTCRRRCRILYGGSYFRCRCCHALKYESQYESGWSRAMSLSHALRQKLGYQGSLDDPFPPKPKGMDWTTYRRLEGQGEELRECWMVEAMGFLRCLE